MNRSDAVRSEDNLSLTDRGCNTVQCTAPHCTALYSCTAVPRTEVMMRLLTVTSPDLPYLSDTPHHDMFPALPTCRTNTVFHVYLSLDSTFIMREKIIFFTQENLESSSKAQSIEDAKCLPNYYTMDPGLLYGLLRCFKLETVH